MARSRLREITITGNVAFVRLTRGLTAIIDAEDVPLVENWNWTAISRCDGKAFYAARNEYLGGGRGNKQSRYVRMHRELSTAE